MSKSKASRLIEQVRSSELRVINQPDIIWLFGSGAEEILDINAPETGSIRAQFYKWVLGKGNSVCYKTPEHYPEWINIQNGYSNLVDLELDLVAISKATIVFSESEGAFAELGVLSCQKEELLKNIMVVVKNRHLNDKSGSSPLKRKSSFINLGPLQKIRLAYKDEDDAPIFGLMENDDDFNSQFLKIKDKAESLSTGNSSKKLDLSSKKHVLYLVLDIIHLLNRSIKKDIQQVLDYFNVPKSFDLTQMLKFLVLIDLVERIDGNNTFYQLFNSKNHTPLVDFSGKNGQRFDRNNFLIVSEK